MYYQQSPVDKFQTLTQLQNSGSVLTLKFCINWDSIRVVQCLCVVLWSVPVSFWTGYWPTAPCRSFHVNFIKLARSQGSQ